MQVTEWMNKFNETGVLEVPRDIHEKACSIMTSYAVSGSYDAFIKRKTFLIYFTLASAEEETLATIKKYQETDNYILCPHSAIGGTLII